MDGTDLGTLDAQGNSAEGSVAGLSLFPNQLKGVNAIGAMLIQTSCTATAAGIATANNFTSLTGLGQTINGPQTPNTIVNITVPNPVQFLPPITIAKATINETINQPNGDVVVNGLHIQSLTNAGPVAQAIFSGDIILAHSHCGPAALPTPMASGAGMWIGLGLLGAIAVPVGAFGIRRRRSGAASAA